MWFLTPSYTRSAVPETFPWSVLTSIKRGGITLVYIDHWLNDQNMAILTYLLVAAVFAALFRRRIAASLRRRRLAAAHGCAPAARRWSLDPILNFDLSIEQMRWMKRGTRLKEYALRCYKGNHTIEYLEMGSRFVLTSDPRNAKAILTTDFANWGMGERRSLPFLDLIGLGILVNDGEAWSHSRKMIKPTFDRKRVSDRGALEPHVDRFMALLPRDGATVDMEPIIGRLVSFRLYALSNFWS